MEDFLKKNHLVVKILAFGNRRSFFSKKKNKTIVETHIIFSHKDQINLPKGIEDDYIQNKFQHFMGRLLISIILIPMSP